MDEQHLTFEISAIQLIAGRSAVQFLRLLIPIMEGSPKIELKGHHINNKVS